MVVEGRDLVTLIVSSVQQHIYVLERSSGIDQLVAEFHGGEDSTVAFYFAAIGFDIRVYKDQARTRGRGALDLLQGGDGRQVAIEDVEAFQFEGEHISAGGYLDRTL